MYDVLVVLGNTNDSKGTLSRISKQRLNKAISLLRKKTASNGILTSGFGNHFNTSPRPHSLYAKEYLIKNGIPERIILTDEISSNTLENLAEAKAIIKQHKWKDILLLTSDFHMPRVKIIAKGVLKGYRVNFVKSKTVATPKKLINLYIKEVPSLIRAIRKAKIFK